MYGPKVTIGNALQIAKEIGGSAERPFVTQAEENIRANDLMNYAKQLDMRERMNDVGEALGQTWPVKMAKGIVGGAKLPGDVASGDVDPRSDEAIQRAMELASLIMLGGGAGVSVAPGQMAVGSGPIRQLMTKLEQEYGPDWARRLERAADEIPNLEKLYTPEALQSAFTRNDQLLMSMKPSDFGKLALPLNKPADPAYIKELANLPSQGGFSDVPWLQIKNLGGYPVVSGHEGRHRSLALEARDQPMALVQLAPNPDMKYAIKEAVQERFPYKNPYDQMRFMMEFRRQLPEDLRVIPQGKSLDEFQKMGLPEPYASGGSIVDQALMVVSQQGLPLPKPPNRQHGGRPRT